MTDERARHLAERRRQYDAAPLELDATDPDPYRQWAAWYDDAVAAGVDEPNAVTLATVDADGHPDCRVVLARAVESLGVVFYTNYDSPKSVQLTTTPFATLNFAWLGLFRQIRIKGGVARDAEANSDAYFATRPRESQIGSWASSQSEVIADRSELTARIDEVTQRFEGVEVDRPPNWGGWVLTPTEFEFWQGQPNRLHDRVRYRHDGLAWVRERLAP